MSGTVRWVWRGAAMLCGAAAIALITVAVLKDLSTADQVASVIGAVLALAAAAGSAYGGTGSGSGGSVRGGGPGSVTAGGNMLGNAIGDDSETR